MWLTLDIGNSTIKAGLFEGAQLKKWFTLQSDPEASVAAYRHTFRHHLHGTAPERIGLVSVVPALTEKVAQALQAETWIPIEQVHARMHLPFELCYHPDQIGSDRLAAVAGAYYRLHQTLPDGHVLVLDAGTACTIEVLEAMRRYRGGLITPGLRLMAQALHGNTAQLPETAFSLPDCIIATTTEEALRAGTGYGFIEMVRGLLQRLQARLDAPSYVLATGGWASFLKEHLSEEIDAVAPHLVLEGVRFLLALNAKRPVYLQPH